MTSDLKSRPQPEPDSDLVEIGRRLRAVRQYAGIRQAQMSALCGVDQTTWSKWENGARTPDVFAIMRFCRRAGASLDLIYQGRPTTSDPSLLSLLRQKNPELLREDKPRTDILERYRRSILQSVISEDNLG